jgi:hypothetical protein
VGLGPNGLDGKPWPIHIDHGARLQSIARLGEGGLINRCQPLAHSGWREERTGLHELEFIQTRHWF